MFYCFTTFFFQMPWMKKPCPLILISIFIFTEKHIIMDVITLWLLVQNVLCMNSMLSVKNVFAGHEEEGCLSCCSCCCLLVNEERWDCSPAKGRSRGVSVGTLIARAGDREERGRSIGSESNSGWKRPPVKSDHVACSGIYPYWALQWNPLNDGEQENCPRVIHLPLNLLRCYLTSGSQKKLLN